MNLYLKKLSEFQSKWKIRTNPEKCKAIVFTPKNRLSTKSIIRNKRNVSLKINNTTVIPDKYLKYLGITFNEKCSFVEHVRCTIRKTTNAYNGIRSAILPKAGLSTRIRMLCYKQLLRPILAYGFPAWSTISSAQMEKIRRLERKLLRACIGYRRERDTFLFESNSQLYERSEITRIDKHLVIQAVKFLNKMAEINSNTMRHPFGSSLYDEEPQPYQLPNFLMKLEAARLDTDPLLIYHRRTNWSSRPESTVYNVRQ